MLWFWWVNKKLPLSSQCQIKQEALISCFCCAAVCLDYCLYRPCCPCPYAMSFNRYMHPRNPFHAKPPDFAQLAMTYAELRPHFDYKRRTIDFDKPEALRSLCCVLLKHVYGEVSPPSLLEELRVVTIMKINPNFGQRSRAKAAARRPHTSCAATHQLYSLDRGLDRSAAKSARHRRWFVGTNELNESLFEK